MIIAQGKIFDLLSFVFMSLLVLYFIIRTKKGKVPTVIRHPAMDSIKEAVGRAVEMGRPVLCTIGGGRPFRAKDVSALIGGLAVLEYTSKVSAELGAEIYSTVRFPSLLTMQRNAMELGFISAGKLEEYDPEKVIFYGDGYHLSTMNFIVDKDIAATVVVGYVEYESGLFSEASSITGAMQVGGTVRPAYMAWIVAGSHTSLIGEEVVAIGALLSGDPERRATLAAEDIYKYGSIGLILLGSILSTLGVTLLTKIMEL